jgi:hypothetical protein
MIVADCLGPWHDVETDGVREQRRLPQFLHDIGEMAWRDVTGQYAETIPPSPGLCVWRVWPTQEQYDALAANATYTVLRSAEVEQAHADPTPWPATVATAGTRATAGDAFPALPTSGWLTEGQIYQYSGEAVRVRQSHNRTADVPSTVPALFSVFRANADKELPWIANEPVLVGTKRTYGGKTWECLQSHVTQADWTPPATPALWREVVTTPTSAWAVGVAYKVGDMVTYQGNTYTCRQPHTSIATWNPVAAASLWLRV